MMETMGKLVGLLVFIVLPIAAVVGWVLNLVQVIVAAKAGVAVTTMFVLKAIGIFAAPLGAVLGYLG